VKMFTITDSVIIGNTPIPGVTITAKDSVGTVDTKTTNAKGEFSVKVPYGWTGEIIPTKEGLRFNPPSQNYTNVTTDMKNREPVMMKQPTPTPAQPTPAQPTPAQPTPAQPTPAQPTTKQLIKTQPTTNIPKPTVAAPNEPAATTPSTVGAQAPKTPLEKDIARIQQQLNTLLRQQAGQEEPATTPAAGGGLTSGAGRALITNSFVDNDLVIDVLPALSEQAGIPIVPDVSVSGIVTADLVDVPLDTALEIVLAGTAYVVKKTPYYYLVCSGEIQNNPLFPKISETRRLRMNYISAEAAVGLLSSAFKQYAQAEISPTTGTSTYTVVVTAPPKLADRIVADLKQIDRPLSQILLDARIVVMEKGDLLNLGVEWGWPTIQAGMFSNDHYGAGDSTLDFGGESPWGIQIGYTPDAVFTNSLELTLKLLAQNGEATILTKPQVMAQDGKESRIEVTTDEYYFLVAPEVTNSFYTRSELETITSGTTLAITPHLGDNNDITLHVAVEVSESTPNRRASDLPVVTRRRAENNVTIKDGGTVALAGLKENRTRKDLKRVPGLSQLPLIGSLFKSNSNENSSREIAVFVTAHLVSNTGETTQFTQPSEIPAPIQPAGGDFRSKLRESLSRR
jgi:type II secretory pathway component GspD/PulD (secretin)